MQILVKFKFNPRVVSWNLSRSSIANMALGWIVFLPETFKNRHFAYLSKGYLAGLDLETVRRDTAVKLDLGTFYPWSKVNAGRSFATCYVSFRHRKSFPPLKIAPKTRLRRP